MAKTNFIDKGKTLIIATDFCLPGFSGLFMVMPQTKEQFIQVVEQLDTAEARERYDTIIIPSFYALKNKYLYNELNDMLCFLLSICHKRDYQFYMTERSFNLYEEPLLH